MKLLFILRLTASIQIIVCCVSAAADVRERPGEAERSEHHGKPRSLVLRKSRKGCKRMVTAGKGKAKRCPTQPRRVTAAPKAKPTTKPVAKPTAMPSATPSSQPSQSPSADACLTYKSDPSSPNSKHLYGIKSATLGFTWLEAQATVRAMKSCCGGVRPHLVSIGSPQENTYVLSLLLAEASGAQDSAFLGLTNRNQTSDTTFVWDGTSEAFGYQNWCTPGNGNCLTTEPDNGPNACAAMLFNIPDVTSGVWVDYDCDLTAPSFFVFEYDCPNPGT